MTALALALAVAMTTAGAEDNEEDRLRWFAIPNVAFDSDDGFVFGARGELALDEPGFEPYKSSFVLHIIFTTRGFMHHRFRYDRIGIGGNRHLRLTAHLAWRQWLNDGYWGIGNTTTRQRAFVGSFDGDDPRHKRYRYSLFQPFAHVTLRADLSGPWQAFGSLNVKWSRVETYEGSLLAEQRPYGLDGGLATVLSAGILWDTREPEVTPESGTFCELSGRYTPPFSGDGVGFGGPFLSLRGYWTLTPGLTFAARTMGEWLFGDIPFYEMVHWGGAVPVAGFGGAETLRGISFGRWRAPGKAVANTELRIDLFNHTLFDRPLRWQIVPWVDAGVVFGAGDLETSRADVFPMHPGGGAGVRAIFDEAFVGRLDSGFGLDPVESLSGNIKYEASWGLYLVFDHIF